MRKWTAATLIAGALAMWAPEALPCGGGFGQGLNIGTSQKIFVSYKGGVETYFFSPHFCGSAAAFGLILPVPASLDSNPQLGDVNLIPQLEDVTKAQIVPKTECRNDGAGGGASMDGGYNGGADAGGVNVINKGQVGMFEFTLLQATDTKAFTDWLDANNYPYDTKAVPTFQYYVDASWYFVAFKVTADTAEPPAGKQLCGDLGPLVLSFPTDKPVVPARIAAAGDPNSYYKYAWRIFSVSDVQKTATMEKTLRFSGALTSDDITNHAALGAMAAVGDRLTEFDVIFYPSSLSSDIDIVNEPSPSDFRRTEFDVTYVDCVDGGAAPPDGDVGGGGCSTGRGGSGAWAAGLLLAAAAALARRNRDA
jgi:hypothetical protein